MSLSLIKYPAAGGGGGTLTGAENGLSLDGSLVVFGQDYGDLTNPAILQNEREVPLNGNYIYFTDEDLGSGKITVSIGPGIISLDNYGSAGSLSSIFFKDLPTNESFYFGWTGTSFQIQTVGAPNAVDIQLGDYPNTRNDAAFAPVSNFLYTDIQGAIKSAPWTVLVNEGLSFGTDLGTKIQLGQNLGSPGDPAAFTSDREIPTNGTGLFFIDRVTGDTTRYSDTSIVLTDAVTSSTLEITKTSILYSVIAPVFQQWFFNTNGFSVVDSGSGHGISGIINNSPNVGMAIVASTGVDPDAFPELTLQRQVTPTSKTVSLAMLTDGVFSIGESGTTAPIQQAYFDLNNQRLGLFTDTPTDGLDINPSSFRIRSGSPGLGKILTSNATGVATWQAPTDAIGYKGGQSAFTANGTATVFDIVHNLGATPSFFTLTTTQPIASNHLTRTITFPDVNTMRLTFSLAPNPGEDANYVWIVYK